MEILNSIALVFGWVMIVWLIAVFVLSIALVVMTHLDN